MPIKRPFFCGIGGSGMLPLAMYLDAQGVVVEGSDRAMDQGRADELRRTLEASGIRLFPQDGSGVRSPEQTLVTSSAVEATIPDVISAQKIGVRHILRAELLSSLCNEAKISVGIAGTSGKSTTTAMLACILSQTGARPSVVNGAPMLNVLDPAGEAMGWQSGDGPFVCEVDESDGSIDLYNPSVGVVLNVSEDHKSLDELERHFGSYAERAGHVVLGLDTPVTEALAARLSGDHITTVSVRSNADFTATIDRSDASGVMATVTTPEGATLRLKLPIVGSFNVSNALAAIAAAVKLGVMPAQACDALSTFQGTARRLQLVGQAQGVAVIDDFAHNPDKIAASVRTLTEQYDAVRLFYQPHGYGPLASFRPLYREALSSVLRPTDRLWISKPAYFGGTTNVTDDAEVLASELADLGFNATYTEDREEFLLDAVHAGVGDAVVVMGARDNSLTSFARDILDAFRARA
ncbi:MAG: Mur ligase family protein [Pseudomonadota bacterium]